MLIMSYYNPLLHYGLDKLAHDAAASGFDGILASDLTVEESGPFLEAMKRSGIEHGVSRSSDKFTGTDSQDRRNFHGVSLCCVENGRYRRAGRNSRQSFAVFCKLFEATRRCRLQSALEYRRPEHLQAVWQEADGAVVGSALVREIEEHCGRRRCCKSSCRVHTLAERRSGMTIEDWRAKIDLLDKRLLELLSERAEYVLAVGRIKSEQNMEVFDPERERHIISNILRQNKGPLDDDALRRIFERVIDECRRIESNER